MIASSHFLVLRTIPYQENHLLLTVLNQNGCIYTLQCLGGQGSQKKMTGQKLDLGCIFQANSMVDSPKHRHLYIKEFELQWFPTAIRNSYRAWSLLHFILEVATLIFDKKDFTKAEWELIKNEGKIHSHEFQVIVKFLYLLDRWSYDKESLAGSEIYVLGLTFLSKMLLLEGVMPNVHKCNQCGQALSVKNVAQYHTPDFYCRQCQNGNDTSVFLWNFFSWSKTIKYEEISRSQFVENNFMQMNRIKYCFDELFLLLNISKENLKTYTLIVDGL